MKFKPIPVKIQIPEPCSQSWAEMTPENGGRHCAACAQTVTDFTRMTDAQILEVLKGSAGGCGRFRADQVNRELIAPPAEKRFSFTAFYKVAASLLLVFSAGKVAAQSRISKAPAHYPEDSAYKKNFGEKRFISGTVFDQSGEPIIGAILRMSNSESIFMGGAQTGIDGEFKCEIPSNISPSESLRLTIEYLGYQKETVNVTQCDTPKILNIVLNQKIGLPINFSSTEVHITGYIKPIINPEYLKSTNEPTVPLNNRKLKTGKTIEPKKWWQFWKGNPKHHN